MGEARLIRHPEQRCRLEGERRAANASHKGAIVAMGEAKTQSMPLARRSSRMTSAPFWLCDMTSSLDRYDHPDPHLARSAIGATRDTGMAWCMTDELVRRLTEVQDLRRAFASATRGASIDQTELDEHRRLVPVQVLVRDLVAFELDDGNERDFHAPSGRCDPRQKPVHADRVREANDHLVDEPVLPDRPG